jgi:hypothetical protein
MNNLFRLHNYIGVSYLIAIFYSRFAWQQRWEPLRNMPSLFQQWSAVDPFSAVEIQVVLKNKLTSTKFQ